MRRLVERVYRHVIGLHLLVNRQSVKTIGSLLYVAGAVVLTLARQHLRVLGRTTLPAHVAVHLKTLLTSGWAGLGAFLQYAVSVFR